jgi:hypothetical protein
VRRSPESEDGSESLSATKGVQVAGVLALETGIDQLVYRLFDLVSEQVATVEEGAEGISRKLLCSSQFPSSEGLGVGFSGELK